MKYSVTSPLHDVLCNKDLKAKNLSSDHYFSILCLKKKLREYLELMFEGEQKLAEEFQAVIENGVYKCADKLFFEKLSGLRRDFDYEPLNFIPKDDFKKWVDDLDINSTDLLAEYLLKQ